jgi:hypothetical protein
VTGISVRSVFSKFIVPFVNGTSGKKEIIDDASIWDDYEDWREGQPMYDTADMPDYVDGWKWTCCGKFVNEEGCMKGPHEGKQYLGLTFTNVKDTGADEDLPDAKHQKVEVPERKFSNAVADLLEQSPAKSVVYNEVHVQFKTPEVPTVPDTSEVEEESEEEHEFAEEM